MGLAGSPAYVTVTVFAVAARPISHPIQLAGDGGPQPPGCPSAPWPFLLAVYTEETWFPLSFLRLFMANHAAVTRAQPQVLNSAVGEGGRRGYLQVGVKN